MNYLEKVGGFFGFVASACICVGVGVYRVSAADQSVCENDAARIYCGCSAGCESR